MPLQDVDEFVLPAVRMAKGGDSARGQPREVDVEVGEAEEVAQRTLLAPLHQLRERRGIDRLSRARRRFGGNDGDGEGFFRHAYLEGKGVERAYNFAALHGAQVGGAGRSLNWSPV